MFIPACTGGPSAGACEEVVAWRDSHSAQRFNGMNFPLLVQKFALGSCAVTALKFHANPNFRRSAPGWSTSGR